MSNTRITVASVSARLDRTDQVLADIVSTLGTLVSALGQHNTPAAVVEITSAPSVKASKKAASKKAAKKATVKPAKREMPADVREGFALVKATKDAISPLNKALAVVCKGTPWVKATERSTDEIQAAINLVAEQHGVDVAQAALTAFTERVKAANARTSK